MHARSEALRFAHFAFARTKVRHPDNVGVISDNYLRCTNAADRKLIVIYPEMPLERKREKNVTVVKRENARYPYRRIEKSRNASVMVPPTKHKSPTIFEAAEQRNEERRYCEYHENIRKPACKNIASKNGRVAQEIIDLPIAVYQSSTQTITPFHNRERERERERERGGDEEEHARADTHARASERAIPASCEI